MVSDWGIFAAGLFCGGLVGAFLERMVIDPLAWDLARLRPRRRGR